MDINQKETGEYENPLCTRYASERMRYIFSPQKKFSTWRKLWLALAKAEKECGLYNITDEALREMEANVEKIDFAAAREYEKKFRHDVMAHIHAFADVCPAARSIIHLGATSAFVGDNADLIVMREALTLLRRRLLVVIRDLCDFSEKYRAIPCLSYTHFQAAQLSTVGRRACNWLKSFMFDLAELSRRIDTLEFRSVKGTVGTAASFRELFNNDYEKYKKLDETLAREAGFSLTSEVTSQTYDRKQDIFVASSLASLASSAHKLTNDLRLLQHEKEMEEPFASSQVGSSAMAYKRNPVLCERISSLAKLVMSLQMNSYFVASTQWLERTLDDSAARRIYIPEAFMATEAILILLHKVISGARVYPEMIEANVRKELAFIASENIMMDAVKKGGDRQSVHEIIRTLSMQTVRHMKEEGGENDLISRIASDGRLGLSEAELKKNLRSENYIGFSVEQTEAYLSKVRAVLAENEGETAALEEEVLL